MAQLPLSDPRMQAALYYARKRRRKRNEPDGSDTSYGDAMVLKFDMSKPVQGDNNYVVSLPLLGTIDCTVDWGDGSEPEAFTTPGRKLHYYSGLEIYTVVIRGSVEHYGSDIGQAYNSRLVGIVQFGDLGTTSYEYAFGGAFNLTTDIPNEIPPGILNMTRMFNSCYYFNGDISLWDVSSVTNMDQMFFVCERFEGDLRGWCVTNIPSEPSGFALYANPLIQKPEWGTCP